MRRWTYALGGLIAWTIHFCGIYAIASIEAQTVAADRGVWQAVATAFSLACAAACVVLLVIATPRLKARGDGVAVLMDQLAALGAGFGLIAIAWQTASAWIA